MDDNCAIERRRRRTNPWGERVSRPSARVAHATAMWRRLPHDPRRVHTIPLLLHVGRRR